MVVCIIIKVAIKNMASRDCIYYILGEMVKVLSSRKKYAYSNIKQ